METKFLEVMENWNGFHSVHGRKIDEAALAAAQKWVFTPALRQGKPVTVWVSIPFRFRLKEN